MPLPDYYAVLGVSADAQPEQIRRAYHGLARRYHPDSSVLLADDTAIKRLNEAYSVLRDPVRRASYDIQLLEERKRSLAAEVLRQRHRKTKKMTWTEGVRGFVREFKRGMHGYDYHE